MEFRNTWRQMEQGLFAAVNFSKAFDSVSHTHASAFFHCMRLPTPIVNMLLFLFRAPIQLLLPAGICLNSMFRPMSGSRQGCPLSRALFALLISPVIGSLLDKVPQARVLLCVDGIMIIVKGSPDACYADIHALIQALRQVERYSTLNGNANKVVLLPKVDRSPAQTHQLFDTDVVVRIAAKSYMSLYKKN